MIVEVLTSTLGTKNQESFSVARDGPHEIEIDLRCFGNQRPRENFELLLRR